MIAHPVHRLAGRRSCPIGQDRTRLLHRLTWRRMSKRVVLDVHPLRWLTPQLERRPSVGAGSRQIPDRVEFDVLELSTLSALVRAAGAAEAVHVDLVS